MKKKLILASLLGLILVLAMGAPAMARHTPRDTHHHHIILPNGTCLDIVSVHDGMKHADDQTVSAVVFHHEFSHGGTGCSEH